MEMVGVWEFQFLKNALFFPKSVFPNLHNLRYDLETLGKSSLFPDLILYSSSWELLPSLSTILSTDWLYIPSYFLLFCFLFLI